MKALFADISEQERRRNQHRVAYKEGERRQVSALFDAIQIAVAEGEEARVRRLLGEIHALVDAALVRRRRW